MIFFKYFKFGLYFLVGLVLFSLDKGKVCGCNCDTGLSWIQEFFIYGRLSTDFGWNLTSKLHSHFKHPQQVNFVDKYHSIAEIDRLTYQCQLFFLTDLTRAWVLLVLVYWMVQKQCVKCKSANVWGSLSSTSFGHCLVTVIINF